MNWRGFWIAIRNIVSVVLCVTSTFTLQKGDTLKAVYWMALAIWVAIPMEDPNE